VSGDWIEWNGGECPVDPEASVCARYRPMAGHVREEAQGFGGGDMNRRIPAAGLRWDHNGGWGDIIAYRVVSA
jgi:hypothetical protein